ncbi:DUF1275 family protein [Actinacidiphila sp. ITFR-21]|uniref:DUF1275 family protein n=1 Tax=Actinacidiphila sp. ITFR-21 TaxID=3075199 RepID=UPI00288A6806|nr:DUF1275 family protein [Streptomyces sp. ITFR-21]WNI14365.1 DUF1275 family protein [Streptomyces sp. ITFR-21]
MQNRSSSATATLLLTLATGALDAIGFLALGGVFCSVMTADRGPIGLAAGSGAGGLAGSALVAVGGFAAGTALGSRIATATGGARRVLLVEPVVLCDVTAGWAAQGGTPEGGGRLALLAAAALAMGCRSGTVRAAGRSGMPTT